MAGKRRSLMAFFQAVLACAVLMIVGCTATQPEVPVPVDVPEPVIVVEAAPELPVAAPVVTMPAPVARIPVPKKHPLIAVVLSGREPSYESVALQLDEKLVNSTVYDLSDKSLPATSVFRSIADSGASAVVAVGLPAAISATAMASVPVIFCQVFNYKANKLITSNSRGVAPLPPLELQIAAWKKIDPTLKTIGAIIGRGHDDLIEEATLAAAAHGIDLRIRTVRSDKETLFVFSRLIVDIDGFLLFPDNRVLSGPVLKEMLRDASRRHVQVAVFNDSLLPLGASMSSSTVDANIADTIVSILDRLASDGIDDVPPITGLTDIRIVTNAAGSVQQNAGETVARE